MASKQVPQGPPNNFQSMLQTDVPHGRNGKHKQIVSKILSDLDRLAPNRALKIPLAELPDSKEKVRSAVNRVTRQRGTRVGSSSDATHLYFWNVSGTEKSEAA
jgi:hypothetical protein